MKLKIDQILEKYWEAETTVDEERILKDYFGSSDIHADHLQYSSLFGYYQDRAKVEMPLHISLEKPQAKVMNLRTWMYAAAAVSTLVLVSIFALKFDSNMTKVDQNTAMIEGEIQDPEEALRVTKEALAMVSSKFNKSKKKVKEQMVNLEKASIFK